jgi:transposase-like protein
MPKKSHLSAAERAQLVLRLPSKGEPAAQIARRAGVSEQTLYRWRDEFISGGRAQLAGRGVETRQARELERL